MVGFYETGEEILLGFSLLGILDFVLLFSSHLSGPCSSKPPFPGFSVLVQAGFTSSCQHLRPGRAAALGDADSTEIST